MDENIPIEALFLGPRSENEGVFEKLILDVVRDHVFWRRNYHVEDPPAIDAARVYGPEFNAVHSRLVQEVTRLIAQLKNDVPFFSPRYLGHMVSDQLMPATVGYIAALLYNPNNVSWDASPVTTRLEIEVGRQFARMFGFGHSDDELKKTWGHITSGGTVANLEALWVAIATTYHPLAVREAARALGAGTLLMGDVPASELTVHQALNLKSAEILGLNARLCQFIADTRGVAPDDEGLLREVGAAIQKHSYRYLGLRAFAEHFAGEGGLPEAVVLVPRTKHYSWVKAAEVFGLGARAVIEVPVDKHYRQDKDAHRALLEDLEKKNLTPAMAVCVCGSTEESAVDDIAGIVACREALREQGLDYLLHCDAAWGGYARSALLDKEGGLIPAERLRDEFGGWPSQEVYDALLSMSALDSITVDPHKLGYVPYPAGAVVFRDHRVRELVAHEAPYAFDEETEGPPREQTTAQFQPLSLGRYVLEGSKPGAAAAAVWLSNRVFPLDHRGYGQLVGRTAKNARAFEDKLHALRARLEGRYEVALVNAPTDLNIVCYLFNPVENRSLLRMNRFNHRFYSELNVKPSQSIHAQDFYVSHTELALEEYGQSLGALLSEQTSVVLAPGQMNESVTVLRSTLMNPFVGMAASGDSEVGEEPRSGDYLDVFVDAVSSFLDKTHAHWLREEGRAVP